MTLDFLFKSYLDLSKQVEFAIEDELKKIRSSLLHGHTGQEKLVLLASNQLQYIIAEIEKINIQISPKILTQINDISSLIQTILETFDPLMQKQTIIHETDFLSENHHHYLSQATLNTLKTAEKLYSQAVHWKQTGIDLSPIINSYCKAVELSMKDLLQNHTDMIVSHGILSQHLEKQGYFDHKVEKMQNFEDYLSDLPIIRTIPNFSKFKLRKILKAICLYKPGKRFTLDSPKAFALFLLVVSRKECLYFPNPLLTLHFKTDMGLFEFVKQVHLLQDYRNKAVHEGLTCEALDDISKMRNQAYSSISACIKAGSHLRTTKIGA